VVVVVPLRFDLRKVPGLVASRADWIERAVSRIERELASLPESDQTEARTLMPTTLQLRACGQSWQVVYDGVARRLVELDDHVLTVPCASDDVDQGRALLLQWLKARTRRDVVPLLEQLAHEHGFEYAGVSVRAQRRRWGSCSAAGRISVSCSLVFLPPELVRHVLLHELCHLSELNHAPGFWDLLDHLDPQAVRHRKEMRSAWKYVPSWVGTR